MNHIASFFVFKYFETSITIAPMLDINTIKVNSKILNGDMSKNLPKDGINIEAAITVKELNTAKIKNLFLKIPTLNAG